MTPGRPRLLIAVVGTATEVGKTWVTAELITRLRGRDLRAAARKPVQSFSADEVGRTDADILAGASGEVADDVCPPHRWLSTPMAPPMAAAALGQAAPTLADLVAELRWPSPPLDVGFVEMVGGVRSPIAADGDSRDLTRAVDPDLVLIVADAGLGVIDAVRLAVDALTTDEWPAPRSTVFLNHFDASDDLHRRNLQWLRDCDGFAVITGLDDLVGSLSQPGTD